MPTSMSRHSGELTLAVNNECQWTIFEDTLPKTNMASWKITYLFIGQVYIFKWLFFHCHVSFFLGGCNFHWKMVICWSHHCQVQEKRCSTELHDENGWWMSPCPNKNDVLIDSRCWLTQPMANLWTFADYTFNRKKSSLNFNFMALCLSKLNIPRNNYENLQHDLFLWKRCLCFNMFKGALSISPKTNTHKITSQ